MFFSLTVLSQANPSRAFFAAKGRTNVELREQFTLASGVSQSMTAFKSKNRASIAGQGSPGSSVAGDSHRPSVSGPIVKVRKGFAGTRV